MKVTRIFTGPDEKSHFETIDLPLIEAKVGKVTAPIPVEKIVFGEIEDVQEITWHNPPCRQYIIMLEGSMEIETGNGHKQTFKAGDILLSEDTTGQGHITRAINTEKRKYLAIPLK